MRTKLVAGNWKMNKTFQEAEELTLKIVKAVECLDLEYVETVLCPPAPFLEMILDLTDETYIAVGAQNIHDHEFGAFTGEMSAPMLQSMHTEYCIIGHSERRQYFLESGELLFRKVASALKYGIIPIFCCGESLPERQSGRHREVVKQQLEESLFSFQEIDFLKIVIAYEPVWAIGTGINATPQQAQEMHAYVRELVAGRYRESVAQHTMILYGGSCNAGNARDLFSQPDVDGGLIGGASLRADEFVEIVRIAQDCVRLP